MNTDEANWPQYIHLMEQLLDLTLDDKRREELALQLSRIATMATPLMAFPLPHRQEGAGVYSL